jgi:hypothetical protein
MKAMPMKDEITNKQLRSFGITVGGIFALIAFWPVISHNQDPRWWIVAIAGSFLVPALVFPSSLFWIHKGWMAFGHIMGWINTRIILSAVFYVVITPVGVFRAWLGKDPMGRRLSPDQDSYRIIRKPRPASHLTRQY